MLRLSAIGDVCNAQAAVLAIAAAWPETRISWIIGKTEAGLIGDTPGIEFIIVDKSRGRIRYPELARQLSGRRFDVALLMHASLRANLMSLNVRAKRRIGFDKSRARDWQWVVSNERIEARERAHVLDGFMQFAEHLGILPAEPQWNIPIGESERAFAEELRADARRLVVLSPCSSQRRRNFRNWSAGNYAQLCDFAADRHDARVLLTGSPTAVEVEYGKAISQAATTKPVNLVGETSLKQLFALIATANVVVCPDSGPAHMATAAGTPVVGLYATSNPDRTGPYLSRHRVVNAYPEAIRQAFGLDVSQVAWGRRVRDPNAMELVRYGAVRDVLAASLKEPSL